MGNNKVPKELTVEGRTFTIQDVINETGLSYVAAALRVRKCDTLEDIFREKRSQYTFENIYIVDGQEFKIRDVAKKLDMSHGGVYKRIMESRTVEELFRPRGYPLKKMRGDWTPPPGAPKCDKSKYTVTGHRDNDWFKDHDDPIFKLTFGWGQPKSK